MRTVTFQSVLNGVAAKLGMDPLRDLNPARAASLTEYINLRLAEAWKFEFWPEWTVSEQRYFAEVWQAGAAVTAGDFRYFQATGKYYQCLNAFTGGIPPAGLVNGSYLVNAGFWIEAAASYAGPDYDATAAYAIGAIVRNPVDGQFYARGGSLRTAGAGTADFNRDWVVTAKTAGYPFYGTAGGHEITGGPGLWVMGNGAVNYLESDAGTAATPDQVTHWAGTAAAPGPTFVAAFTVPDPSNAAYWCVLTPFDKFVAYEQPGRTPLDEVKYVTRRDPRVWPERTGRIAFAPSADGIQVLDPCAPGVVWVTFRQRPPQFTSTLYSATANVVAGDVRYWPSKSGGTGECYTALQAQTPAAQSPANAAYWSKLSFPDILGNFVKRAVFADALSDQKQQDRKASELADAYSELEDASDRALAGQGQFERAEAATYGG